nr:metallophosphoesterase [Kofleriaceae bacterium]
MSHVLPSVFGLVFSAGLHVYLWSRIGKPMERGWRRRAVGIAIVVMWLMVPVTTTARMWAPELAKVAGWVTLTWMAFAGLTVVALLAIDVGRLAVWAARRVRGVPASEAVAAGPSRRQFLAGSAAAVAGASVGVGMIEARGEHEIVDVEVTLAKLPAALDGFTIVQLSDLHVGMTIGRDFVERVVSRANALSPDLILLTGDLVDGPVADLADDVAPLAQLHAPHGVFATTGNHEYYSGVDAWIAAIEKLGVRYLRNERVAIQRGGCAFDLAGVDDYSGDNYPGHGEDLDKALAGRDASRALVLMAHQPRQVHHAVDHGVDLQLSGHTHGGQIWPWHFIVKLQQGGFLGGRYAVGDTQLYVTRGCGYWGPPVRVLAPLEITRVILRAA